MCLLLLKYAKLTLTWRQDGLNLGKSRNVMKRKQFNSFEQFNSIELFTLIKLCACLCVCAHELSNQMKQLNGLFCGFNEFVYTHLWAEHQSQRPHQEHLTNIVSRDIKHTHNLRSSSSHPSQFSAPLFSLLVSGACKPSG